MRPLHIVVFALVLLFIYMGHLRRIALKSLYSRKKKPCATMQYESEYFNLFDDSKSRESKQKEKPILPP
tara:strand:- start:98 stop:304 length:207 start_codon:yes stop_codon:yes gene_type:complete